MITWWKKLGGNRPPGDNPLLFSISGTGSFICRCSRTDTAGHTKAFDYPVTQTRLDIPRPLTTQSHRHGWTYQGLWLPSHTDTAGHTKAFDYPVTQTRLDIPRPLITQSHRHGWTYQGLWLPSHTDTAGHTKAFDYPVTQTRLDIPRPLITQSHRHGWTYQGLWLPSHTDTAGHTKTFDYPVTQTRLDIPRPLITQSQGTGEPKCSVPRVGLESAKRRFRIERAIHWASPAPPYTLCPVAPRIVTCLRGNPKFSVLLWCGPTGDDLYAWGGGGGGGVHAGGGGGAGGPWFFPARINLSSLFFFHRLIQTARGCWWPIPGPQEIGHPHTHPHIPSPPPTATPRRIRQMILLTCDKWTQGLGDTDQLPEHVS